MMDPHSNAEYMRKVFHDQVEWFIKKYAPSRERHPYEHFEFIADFCLVIRDLGVNGQQAYQHVATESFKKMHETIAMMPMPPVIIPKDK
jgi:hypothetical protein